MLNYEPGKMRGISIGFGLIVAVGVFHGFRNHGIMDTVEAIQIAPADQLTYPASSMPDTSTINAKAWLVHRAEATERDPFGNPPKKISWSKPNNVKSGEGIPAPSAPAPKKVTPPTLRALLFDTVNPSVKLTRNGEVSGWLHLGDSFGGWKISEITPAGATVERDGKAIVLE